MKTQLLKAITPGYMAFFLDDLRLLWTDEHRPLVTAVSSWLTAFLAAGSDAEREKLVDNVSESSKATREDAKKAFGMLAFVAPGISQTEARDTFINDFCTDVETLLAEHHLPPLAENECKRLCELLSGLAPSAAEIKRSLSISQIKRGVLPMYERIEATVEMRALESPFSSETESRDVLLELLPLVTMRVILDSGDPSEICFQATEDDLVELLRKIQQLQTALIRLKERVLTRKEQSK